MACCILSAEGLLKQRAQYGGVDAHIEFDPHTLRAGPHHFSDYFNGLPVAMEGNGHADRLADRDFLGGLDKYTPAVNVGNKIDETEIHDCIADL